MSEEEKFNSKKIIEDLLKVNPTLSLLTKFEEDRSVLAQLNPSLYNSEGSSRISEMAKIIANPMVSEAFRNKQTVSDYVASIISSDKNKSLKHIVDITTTSMLTPEYEQSLKAVDKLSKSLESASLVLGNDYMSSYHEQIKKISKELNEDKLSAASNIVGLASKVDSDLFKRASMIDNLNEERRNIEFDIHKPPLNFEFRFEESPMGITLNKQVEHLEKVSNYILEQTDKIEDQRQISIEHNKIIKSEIESNSKIAKRDFKTLLISIVISILIPIIIYYVEDISDDKNHKELIDTLNNNGNLNNQVEQLKETVKKLEEQNLILMKDKKIVEVNK